MSNNV
jgi:dynein heavy chain